MTTAVNILHDMLKSCSMCPRLCGVDRTSGELGACRTGELAQVSSAHLHFGEEAVLVGQGGSGTIFFGGCNLHCVFCQNADISQQMQCRECSTDEITKLALQLIESGCENINFVTPTHVSHVVADVCTQLRQTGHSLPTVYNCGGYESIETLQALEGLIDIYMPDFKYGASQTAESYSGVKEYTEIACTALQEMYRQQGPLSCDERGIALQGVMVRHLVLPGDIAESKTVIDLVAEHAPGSAINIMGQYRPVYQACNFPELHNYPNRKDIQALQAYAAHRNLQVLYD